jgi:GNAT superfamily N-acetyltransferase
VEWQRNGIRIVDEKDLVDPDAVYNLLKESYWANNRSKETIARSFEHSICFSVLKDSRQIGFARVVTDYVLFAWIADVIIDPQFRGQGIGKFLMQSITGHPAIATTMQLLRTRDAHGLYEQFDFQRNECMVRRK